MKKHLFVLTALFLLSFTGVKAQITFTILNTSGSNSITCATPTINLLCITNYTASFVTYTMAGPSGTAIGNNFQVTLPGTYTLTAFSTSMVNATQTLAIGINTQTPVSAITPTTQNITCSFTSVTTVSTTAISPTSNVTHLFISPQGSSLSVQGAFATYVPGIVGTHTYALMNNVNGCKTNKLFLVNSVSGIPSLSLSCPQNFTLGCNSNSVCSVALQGIPAVPFTPMSYTVLSSSSTTNYVTNSQNLYQLTSPGTYTAIAHDNNSSCESRVLFSISMNTVNPNISLFTNTQTLSCTNTLSVLYGISTSPNTSYSWSSPGSTLISSGYSLGVTTNASPNNSVLGTYSFMVTDNVNACTSETSIVMYQNTYAPNALIGNTGPNAVTCSTPSVTLNNQSSTGIPPFTFNNTLSVVVQYWSGPSTPTSSGNSIVAFSVGTYSLMVQDPNNGCTAQATYSLGDARSYPVVNSPAGPPPYCLDPPTTSVDISPILGGAVTNYTYFWVIPGAATVTGQNTPTLTTNAVGAYTILVTNTVSGCTTSGQVLVTVCTGLETTLHSSTDDVLYPNPGSSVFYFETTQAPGCIKLYNLEGKLIKEYTNCAFKTELRLDDVPAGLYLLKITTPNGPDRSLKLLKE